MAISLVPVLLPLAAMKQLTIRLAFAIALASSFDVFTTRGAAAPQDAAEPRTPVVSRPGSPAPIVGGIRPPVLGSSGGVSAGHPLTSAAALEILLKGGNAFDAGVASVLVGGVIEQDLYSLGGESLILVYPVKDAKVTSIVGQGWAPKGATLEYYQTHNKKLEEDGLNPAVIPGALAAALTVLEKWGTMSFEQVAARAIAYAEDGFPLRPRTLATIQRNLEFFKSWPDNQKYWLKPDGSMYLPGETIKLPTLADTLKKMVEAERKAKKKGRAAAIVAARDRFYKGDIADRMVAFLQKHDAPFEKSDFAEFFAKVEEPTSTTYKGYTVYKQSFGSQGPSLLQTLNILENFDLRAMGHNSPDYIHTLIEAMKLSYADRDTYYADPEFVKVPGEGLLSKEYAKERAAQIDMKRASTKLIAGDPLQVRHPREDLAVLGRQGGGRPLDRADADAAAARQRRHPQGHDAHVGDRQGRQHVRHDVERRLDQRRRRPRRHRHPDEHPRRAVLARRDARQPAAAPRPAPLHADAEPRAQGRQAVHGPRHARGATTRSRPSCRRSSTSWSSGRTGIPTCTRPSPGRACRRCTSTVRWRHTAPASTG